MCCTSLEWETFVSVLMLKKLGNKRNVHISMLYFERNFEFQKTRFEDFGRTKNLKKEIVVYELLERFLSVVSLMNCLLEWVEKATNKCFWMRKSVVGSDLIKPSPLLQTHVHGKIAIEPAQPISFKHRFSATLETYVVARFRWHRRIVGRIWTDGRKCIFRVTCHGVKISVDFSRLARNSAEAPSLMYWINLRNTCFNSATE
jgi:hypothetical protein